MNSAVVRKMVRAGFQGGRPSLTVPSGVGRIGRGGKEAVRNLRGYDMSDSTAGQACSGM